MAEEEPFGGRVLAKKKAESLARLAKVAPPETAAAGTMVDVGGKPIVSREAVAEGFLRLSSETVRAIRERKVPKGDPLAVAEVAGILAAKKTSDLIPLCHPIPLTSVSVSLEAQGEGVLARARVRAEWRTGVEMEALLAATTALLTVWDMTKALEKDESGQYPETRLEGVRVVEKRKGSG